jgi:hypothetical protein
MPDDRAQVFGRGPIQNPDEPRFWTYRIDFEVSLNLGNFVKRQSGHEG